MPSTTTPPSGLATRSAPGRSGTMIRLERVTKDFGLAAPAVADVSLDIQPGEFLTFLGPSGSGKTTTLNLVAGFETLTSGTISFNGEDVSALPPHRRNLGMLFQNYALFPHMTVAQNVAYPLRERRVPAAETARRVAEVLELVQLPGRDHHYPSQLSGGQQQRVALARAIVFDPTALLLDEPLGALDRNLRGALQQEIRRIHREVGSTFVFVTHDQEEAMSLSDRIALFNNGHIEAVGTPEELYRRPATLFTATFLGDSNVFELTERGTDTVRWQDSVWSVRGEATPTDGDASLIVRPEDVRVVGDVRDVPAGASSTAATVTDLEYLGAYRTAMLAFGDSRTVGRARLDASDTTDVRPGDPVVAWWPVDRQTVVSGAPAHRGKVP